MFLKPVSRRIAAAALAAALFFGMIPVNTAHAETAGLCEHLSAHQEGCPYTPAQEEVPCEVCTETDENGAIVHGGEGCTWQAAAEEIPCTCPDCQSAAANETDADTDTDTGTETDVDTDADTETDADADTETDTDTNTDTDTDTAPAKSDAVLAVEQQIAALTELYLAASDGSAETRIAYENAVNAAYSAYLSLNEEEKALVSGAEDLIAHKAGVPDEAEDSDHTHTGSTQVWLPLAADSKFSGSNSTFYYLTEDTTISTISSSISGSANICLNGKTLTWDYSFMSSSMKFHNCNSEGKGTLIIENQLTSQLTGISMSNLTVKGNLPVAMDGSLTLDNCTVDGSITGQAEAITLSGVCNITDLQMSYSSGELDISNLDSTSVVNINPSAFTAKITCSNTSALAGIQLPAGYKLQLSSGTTYKIATVSASTLTLPASAGVTVSIDGVTKTTATSYSVYPDQKITLTPTVTGATITGVTFSSSSSPAVTIDTTAGTATFTMPEAAVTISSVSITLPTYSLTLVGSNVTVSGTGVSGSGTSYTVTLGTTVTLTPAEGYEITEVSSADVELSVVDGSVTFSMPAEDVTVTVTTKQKTATLTLTGFTVTGPGVTENDDGSYTIVIGSQVTLTPLDVTRKITAITFADEALAITCNADGSATFEMPGADGDINITTDILLSYYYITIPATVDFTGTNGTVKSEFKLKDPDGAEWYADGLELSIKATGSYTTTGTGEGTTYFAMKHTDVEDYQAYEISVVGKTANKKLVYGAETDLKLAMIDFTYGTNWQFKLSDAVSARYAGTYRDVVTFEIELLSCNAITESLDSMLPL